MNERGMKTKKNSQVYIKNPDKTLENSSMKSGSNCQPKQPPNISRFYQGEQTKKKQPHSSKETKFKEYETGIFCGDGDKTKTKVLGYGKLPRHSLSKNQDQIKIRKNKKGGEGSKITHIMTNKIRCGKQNNRENKQPHSLVECEELRRLKNTKTQGIMFESEKNNRNNNNLECKQKLMKKLKKAVVVSGKNPLNHDISRHLGPKNTTEHYHRPLRSFEQQMAQFEILNLKIQNSAETQALNELFEKEQHYSSLKNYNCYLSKNQPEIDWFKRTVTMDWMIQILSELRSKREVFALAANYVDRYLASTQNLPLEKLQLLACAAMSLGNKIEGITFNLQSLTKQLFSTFQVLQFEQTLAMVLKWKLNPPTANMWANRISKHWDMYLQHNISNLPPSLLQNIDTIKFKSQDNEGYKNFRMLMQYIDLTILDIHTLRYHSRELAASFLYIILNLKLKIYTDVQILSTFPKSSKYLLEQTDLNQFYCQFLQQSFSFALTDLLPTIQYCSTFLQLPLCFQLPNGISIEQQIQIQYSQLCSLQTWNQANKRTIRHRNRQHD